MSCKISIKVRFLNVILFVISFFSAAEAATFNVANGDWPIVGNWNPVGLPGAADIATIDGSRVCNFDTTSSVEQLKLGVGSNGTLNISGGTLTTGNVDKSLWVGDGAGAGYLTMTGGQIISNSRWVIAGDWDEGGTAVINLSGSAKMSQVGGIGHCSFAYSSTSSLELNMSGSSEIAITNLASNQYVDFRLGAVVVNQSDSSRFYTSGNLRTGVSSTTLNGAGVNWTMTGGTIEAGYGIHLYDDSHINIGGSGEVYAKNLSINDTCTFNISNDGSLNVIDLDVSQVEVLIAANKITGTGLQVSSVDIGGTTYTQVVSPLAGVLTADFNVPDGDWSVAGNWDPAELPFTNDTVRIDSSRMCNFNTDASVADVNLGIDSDGTLNINGGTLRTVNLNVGSGTTGLGTINLQTGTVTTDNLSISSGNTSKIEVTSCGILNIKNLSVAQVTALIGTKITGSDLAVSNVDIGGTTYAQVYSDLNLSLNVTKAKNCSPVDISGGDCIADLNDLEMMVSQWLDVGAVMSDLSGNNEVDFKDFAMLAEYWLDEGPFEIPTDDFTIIKTPDSSSYVPGSSVLLIAMPQEGWRLNYWAGDFASGSYIAEVEMDSSKNITAVYSQSNAAHDEMDYTKLPIIVPGQEPIITEWCYIGERDLYEYNPSFYPGEPAFDYNNRAYMRATSTINGYSDGSTDGYIQELQDDGTWKKWDIIDEVQRSYPSFSGQFFAGVGVSYNRIVFDKDGDAYTHVRLNSAPSDVVLYKPRDAEHWQCVEVENFGYPRLEANDTYKTTAQPPFLVGTYNGGIFMETFTKTDGSLSVATSLIPLAHSFWSPGLAPDHSGAAAVTATFGDKTWLVYASSEAEIDPNTGEPIPGTPQYIISYNHSTQTLGNPVLLGFGQNAYTPEPDNHNGPAIVADSNGLLHVVMGAHQSDLWYTHSTTTNPTSISDWTIPVSTGTLRQSTAGYTYPSLVIDSNDTLHLVARNVSFGQYPEGGSLPGMTRTLDYMRAKRSGSTWTWQDMSYLLIPWHDNYSVYYQKMSIDKDDRLFLFYHYYHNQLTAEEVDAYEAKYNVSAGSDTGSGWYDCVLAQEPVVLMSDDGGDTWRIALTGDFLNIVD